MVQDAPPPSRMSWKQLGFIVLVAAAVVTLILLTLGGDWSRLFP